MARWEPEAFSRLQRAAMELFVERGYDQVTVAEIAERAGLTKRSFFNHFGDKREVLFVGAPAFEAAVLGHLASVTASPGRPAGPLDAAVLALAAGAQELTVHAAWACARRELIASAPELQERNLLKMASLAAAIAQGLARCGTDSVGAMFAAQAAVSVFCQAYDRWTDEPGEDFTDLVRQALENFRRAVAALTEPGPGGG